MRRFKFTNARTGKSWSGAGSTPEEALTRLVLAMRPYCEHDDRIDIYEEGSPFPVVFPESAVPPRAPWIEF